MKQWVFWIAMAIVLIFLGWSAKSYAKDLGGVIMGIGFILAGYLVIRLAHKNLK